VAGWFDGGYKWGNQNSERRESERFIEE